MAKEIVRERELMNGIIAKHTGQPIENVAKDTDRDFILTAEQAVEYEPSTRSSRAGRSGRCLPRHPPKARNGTSPTRAGRSLQRRPHSEQKQ
jgi:hypothetical protein